MRGPGGSPVAPYGLAAAGAGLAGWVLALKLADGTHPALDIALSSLTGLLYLVAGVAAQARRPDNRCGLLMIAVGIGVAAEDIQFAAGPVPHTIGLLLRSASTGFLVNLVLVFPSGRLHRAGERYLAAAGYAIGFGLVPVAELFTGTRTPNLLLISEQQWPDDLVDLAALPVSATIIAVLALRWRAAGAGARRVLGPVLGCSVAGSAAAAAAGLARPVSDPLYDLFLGGYQLAACLLPVAFGLGVLRLRSGQGAVGRLVEQLRSPCSAARLDRLLADALGDPTARVGYWVDGGYLAADGAALPAAGPGRAISLVERDGRRVAAIAHDETLREDGHLLRGVIAAAGLALDNQRLAAEVGAQLAEVRASRARIVAAADAERERMERDLHDSVQPGLVAALVGVRLASRDAGTAEAAGLLAGAASALEDALREVRALAHGIRPAILGDAGLVPALRELAERSPIRVELRAGELPRLHPAVESTAYLVVGEALTNALKHADASVVRVDIRGDGGQLQVEVGDDGVGAVLTGATHGLRGLRDRVLALDGELAVRSSPGAGTVVSARLPRSPA